jgi:succinate dehydrogenase / fumarate reductase, membrane anchor subunit
MSRHRHRHGGAQADPQPSTHPGTKRFLHQRLTAVANIVLVGALVLSMAAFGPADYETVILYLTRPWVIVLLAAFIIVASIHMRIGLGEIIEDYIQTHNVRAMALRFATILAVTAVSITLLALAKINLGL